MRRPAAGELRARLVEGAGALRSSLHSRDLRRAQLSFAAAWTSEWTFMTALTVYAFELGGVAAAGIAGAIRMVPAAVLTPLLAVLCDRWPREQVLLAVGLVRAVATLAAALLAATGGPEAGVYALAAVSTGAFTLFRPAHSALLPSLCRTPAELTSASAARGVLDGVAVLVGPLLATLLIATGSAAAAFAAVALLSLASALMVAPIRCPAVPSADAARRSRPLAEAVEGVRAVAQHPPVALLVGLAAVQTFVRGALSVLAVVIAVELLHTGSSGAGVLLAAVGVGGLLGGLATSLLADSRRLATWFGAGVALWGLPLALIGALPSQLLALLLLLTVVGVGNALVDVGLFTLPSRLLPDRLVGRVFGVLESVIAASVALGSLAAPALIAAFGTRGALIAIGMLAPTLVLLNRSRLAALDDGLRARDNDIALLRALPMLRPLSIAAIDALAGNVHRRQLDAGRAVFAQGDHGDHYYLVEAGQADVFQDGELLRTIGRGEGFGEIALLRNVPRTASVRAHGQLHLIALARSAFIATVTGYRDSTATADAVIATRLAGPREHVPSNAIRHAGERPC